MSIFKTFFLNLVDRKKTQFSLYMTQHQITDLSSFITQSLNLSWIMLKMAIHTLKILQYSHRKIFNVCLAIFQYYAWEVKININHGTLLMIQQVSCAQVVYNRRQHSKPCALIFSPLTDILRGKWPCSELFWSAFFRIRTEYGEIRSISPYSVRMRENVQKMRTRINLNTDTFYAVTSTL